MMTQELRDTGIICRGRDDRWREGNARIKLLKWCPNCKSVFPKRLDIQALYDCKSYVSSSNIMYVNRCYLVAGRGEEILAERVKQIERKLT